MKQKVRIHISTDPAIKRHIDKKVSSIEEKIQALKNHLINNYYAPNDFLTKETRLPYYCHARFVFYYLLDKENLIGCSQFEKRYLIDHTSFIYGRNKVRDYIDAKKRNLGKVINRNFEKYEPLLIK